MTVTVNGRLVIDDNGNYIIPSFSTRANLPTGASGYLSYVADQQEFVVNTATAVSTSSKSADQNITWYKFLIKPMDYKNEVIIEQGTAANGYVGSSIYNTIHRIVHAQDILQLMTQTTPWTSKYGGWHSTEKYAYYHQGNNEGTTTQGAAKQDWATHSVTTLSTRPSLSGQAMNSLQPGPKLQNTLGVLNQGTAGCYITFASDSWTSSGYGITPGTNYGWGAFSQSYGYSWSSGYSNTYKMNWPTQTWAAGPSSPSAAATGNLGKALNSKWNKLYHCGDSGSSQASISKLSTSADTWTTTQSQINPQAEHVMVMGQDWGYLLGGYGPSGSWSGQNAYSQRMGYITDSISRVSTRMDGSNSLSSGNGCWGPM
jgi:hypothetical protein